MNIINTSTQLPDTNCLAINELFHMAKAPCLGVPRRRATVIMLLLIYAQRVHLEAAKAFAAAYLEA